MQKVTGYEELQSVLEELTEPMKDLGALKALLDAYQQCAVGKGAVRHSQDGDRTQLPWRDQIIFSIPALLGLGTPDAFTAGQALKKLHEQRGLDWERGRNECLGAIVYLAASVVQHTQFIETGELRNPVITYDPKLSQALEAVRLAYSEDTGSSDARRLLLDAIVEVAEYVAWRDQKEADAADRHDGEARGPEE